MSWLAHPKISIKNITNNDNPGNNGIQHSIEKKFKYLSK